jgi:hypothetical protein
MVLNRTSQKKTLTDNAEPLYSLLTKGEFY